MKTIVNSFTVSYQYPVHFAEGIFKEDNYLLKEILPSQSEACGRKILFVIDQGVNESHPQLMQQIKNYFDKNILVQLCEEILVVPGGEVVKNSTDHLQIVLDTIERNKLCRHSFLVGIGGGAVLDMIGYAATIAHRGVRHIRIPTTVLAQNDSGVGVKNGINAFCKKNFLGTFSPPFAVINDSSFLKTLSERDWRSGISEAVKVALIKDKNFFSSILSNAEALVERDMNAMEDLIFRCAELHMNHIAKGDPFERGSSRPLDFGHWSAHKLEQLTSNRIKHGEAVAIGIALDATISFLSERLSLVEWKGILALLSGLGFNLYDEELGKIMNEENPILKGLEEFREHLGGKLTIMLLEGIGKGVEVNEIDKKLVLDSIVVLKNFQKHLEDENGDESNFFFLSKAS